MYVCIFQKSMITSSVSVSFRSVDNIKYVCLSMEYDSIQYVCVFQKNMVTVSYVCIFHRSIITSCMSVHSDEYDNIRYVYVFQKDMITSSTIMCLSEKYDNIKYVCISEVYDKIKYVCVFQKSMITSSMFVSLGGSIGCPVRLETRRSRVQPPPRSETFFRGDCSLNIFNGHSLPSTDSRRAVVSFWRKNVHNTG